MQVKIVQFPSTPVAVAEHCGAPEREYETSARLVAWRRENGVSPTAHHTYGVHYTDPRSTPPADHRVDFCVSYDPPISENAHGVIRKVIPACRFAQVRHLGSRHDVAAARWLCLDWLPASGERPGEFPLFFHYVNVGPDVREDEMITDVYLPLADPS
ncbi:MAG: GyrI-like domain-containing protein [Planctomycetota bacterium]